MTVLVRLEFYPAKLGFCDYYSTCLYCLNCWIICIQKHTTLSRMACALIIAGGIGNLIDRVFNNGYVIELYSCEIFPPIFNFADCCVSIGVVLLFYLCNFLYRFTSQKNHLRRKSKRKKK